MGTRMKRMKRRENVYLFSGSRAVILSGTGAISRAFCGQRGCGKRGNSPSRFLILKKHLPTDIKLATSFYFFNDWWKFSLETSKIFLFILVLKYLLCQSRLFMHLLLYNKSSGRRPRSHYKLLSFFEISSPLLKYLFTHFATQIPHQCTAISLFIPFVCNVHTSTVISFIRSSKFVYIVYVIT